MAEHLGGGSFPAYQLLYSNDGGSIAGLTALTGGANTWSTDGESISCAGAGVACLRLVEGFSCHAFIFGFDLKFSDDGTEGYPISQLGLGLYDSAVSTASSNSNALDITITGANSNFGSYSVWIQTDRRLETPAFTPGAWVHITCEIVGLQVGVWVDTVYIGSFTAYRTGFDSGVGGVYDAIRITNWYVRSADEMPPRIKNISVYGSSFGEFT